MDPALARALQSERPDLRVVLTSGYGESVMEQACSAGPLFIEKPFSPDQLDEAVRSALTAPPPDLVPDYPEA